MRVTLVADTLSRDAAYTCRTLRNNPTFALTAIVTLALAIGANTAIFTVVRSVLLRPLQYHDPDRIVELTRGDLADAYLANGRKDMAREHAQRVLSLLDSHAAPASSWSDTEERRGEIRKAADETLKKAGEKQ
jgi:hypothetical protein